MARKKKTSNDAQKNAEPVSWADNVADELTKKKRKVYVCEGMWSPSGYFHIGNARSEVFTPYAVYLALKNRGENARQNFIIDDFDPIDKIPEGIPVKKTEEEEFLGRPYALAPSPLPGHKTWAECFVSEARQSLSQFGLDLNTISAYETYKSGKLNKLIEFSLNRSREIVGVWNSVAGAEKPETFIPLQVVCGKCSRLAQAKSWDGKVVGSSCACGDHASTSPFDGNAKLHWRVHWVAHWALHNVAFESGGKDHFSRGGSVDVGRALCREVFKITPPHQTPTEFLLLGGRKMAGSSGNLFTLSQWLEVAPPELFRYLNFSYRAGKAVEFSLYDQSFLLLMERYERAERIYYGLEKAENEKIGEKMRRAYELSCISKPAKSISFQIPYSFAAFISQLADPQKEPVKALELLGQTGHITGKITSEDKEKIKQKLICAKNWVMKYAPNEFKIEFAEELPASAIAELPELKPVLGELAAALPKKKSAGELQTLVFDCAKAAGIAPKKLFCFLYLALIGRERGPRIGTLIIALGKGRVTRRLQELSR